MPDEPTIDWNSADVSAVDQGLTVGFAALLPPRFLEILREVAAKRSREARGPWGEVGIQFNELIHVRGVEEGAEDGLKRELQYMVEETTRRIAELQQRQSRQDARDQQEPAEREDAAKRMQDRFRS
jgi:hypothetical protein